MTTPSPAELQEGYLMQKPEAQPVTVLYKCPLDYHHPSQKAQAVEKHD